MMAMDMMLYTVVMVMTQSMAEAVMIYYKVMMEMMLSMAVVAMTNYLVAMEMTGFTEVKEIII